MRCARSHFFAWFLLSALLVVPPVQAVSSATPRLKLIPADNPDYVYAGRVDFSDPTAPKFYWAGNSTTIGFTGRKISIELDNPAGDNYFDVVIGGDGAHRHVIHCLKGRHVYVVDTHLANTRHTVEIFRRVDPVYSVTDFDGIEIGQADSVFHPALHHRLKIEFYGDSITSGYGVLDATRKDNGNPASMDAYVSYAAVASRLLHADYRSISLSGIGILKSWFPLVMPQMYGRLSPRDPDSHWDFSKWVPDVVVINLLQNDSWLLPMEKHPPSARQITDAYARFVQTLRTHYPNAAIICMLGNMDIARDGSPWPGYVKAAVLHLRTRGDQRLHVLLVPYKNTPGHPDVVEQRSMAVALVKKIESVQLH